MKKEVQLSLEGNNITTKFGSLEKGVYHKKSVFKVLKAFYDDYTEIGLSRVELKKILKMEMCSNTISNGLLSLEMKGFVSLCTKDVGPTKRRKYYKITEKGASIWERFIK